MANRFTLPNVDFTTSIHTLQCTTDEMPILSEDEIRSKSYVKRFRYEYGRAIYAINPNKYGTIENISLSHLNQIMESIFCELGIRNYRLSRVDVSINTTTPYNDIYKINKFIKELYATHLNEDNAYNSNGDDFSRRSMKVTNRDYELEIYNKEIESKGTSSYRTRIEFRCKRLRKGQSFASVLDYVSRTLSVLKKELNALTVKKAFILHRQYLVEQDEGYEGRVQSLTSFVSKHADDIYTQEILNSLYKMHCTGQCKNWLYQYRRSGKTLTLYSKQNLASYLKQLQMANEAYVKGIARTSLSPMLQSA